MAGTQYHKFLEEAYLKCVICTGICSFMPDAFRHIPTTGSRWERSLLCFTRAFCKTNLRRISQPLLCDKSFHTKYAYEICMSSVQSCFHTRACGRLIIKTGGWGWCVFVYVWECYDDQGNAGVANKVAGSALANGWVMRPEVDKSHS